MSDTVLNFEVQGLHCGSCVGRAEAALGRIPGARDVRVNLATHQAHVAGVSGEDALRAMAQAGYPATVENHSLHIPDMSCGSCVGRVEAAVRDTPGILDARAHLPTRTLKVQTLGAVSDVEKALQEAGYPPSIATMDDIAGERDDPVNPLLHRFLLAAALTLPVFLTEMGGHLYPPLHRMLHGLLGHGTLPWIHLALTALVLAGPGAGFFRRGIPGLLKARPDMDALVALGAGAAFLFSAVAVIAPTLLPPTGVYFEAAAVIVTLILMGRWLEARAKGRTGDAVRRLLELRPETAIVLRAGVEVTVPLEQIGAGDILRAKPGTRIAVDGRITEGQSHVDTAMLTGEPIPVLKSPGDAVQAGTLTTTGSFLYEATHVGRDTVLARISALTADAQAARLPVEALVNRITARFVPAVLGLAALTFAIWLLYANLGAAVVASVSVLIIACPCAMGLATPMSIMVGTGRAAELGVLFHKGAALQQLQAAKVIAFDKTGTLTVGKPSLTNIVSAGSEQDALRLAAGVEGQSEHPIAHAILDACPDVPVEVSGFEAVPGEGAQARVEGQQVVVGNAAMLARNGISPSQPLIDRAQAYADKGATLVHVAAEGRHEATLAISDTLRDGASDAISDLKGLGRKVAMITGDGAAAARHVAQQLGIEDITAEVRPDGKVDAIRALQKAHGPVAFFGDGINDAPALAAAEVGLAVGGASDIAIEAADVVMLSPEPAAVARAVRISAATLRNIRQNLVWAFGYNVLLIPVAAGVLVPFGGPQLSPQLAALAMALSSVFVVTNALRLRKVRAS